MKRVWIIVFILISTCSFGQAPSGSFPPTASMKQLMLDLIHPASNDILLLIYRGGPKDDNEWASVRRNALTLAESGNLLMMPGRTRGQGDWIKHVRMLVDAGTVDLHSILMMNDPDEARRLAMHNPSGGIVSLDELPDFIRLVAAENSSPPGAPRTA